MNSKDRPPKEKHDWGSLSFSATWPFFRSHGFSSPVRVDVCFHPVQYWCFGALRPLWRLAIKRSKESFQFLMAVVGSDIYATGNHRSREKILRRAQMHGIPAGFFNPEHGKLDSDLS